MISSGVFKPAKGESVGKGRQRLRRLPGEHAAKKPAAAAKPHGGELVGGRRRKARAGEADDDAAVGEEFVELAARIGIEAPDIGEH